MIDIDMFLDSNPIENNYSLDGKNYISPGDDFNESLKVEKIGQPVADAFYKDHLKALDIRRYNWNNPQQRVLQKLDIDCAIELKATGLDLFWLNISEKFRQFDTGDMCIELWSDFEKKKLGWAVHENKIGPDYYLYVTPKHFFEVLRDGYFSSMIEKITKEWNWNKINEFVKEEEKKLGRTFEDNGCYKIKVDGHDAQLVKTWTTVGNKKWYGICICIPWKTLFNDYLLDINMYNRKYELLNINKEYV